MCECPFSIRETTLIGPKLTENVKVNTYEGINIMVYLTIRNIKSWYTADIESTV